MAANTALGICIKSYGVNLFVIPQSLIIQAPVRDGVIVNPVLFSVGHAFSPRHFTCGPGPIEGATFRTVAECFESVPFLGRVPVVDDHFDRHPTTPDAS